MSEPAVIRLKRLNWVPHLQPVEVEDATPRQLEAMKVTPSATKVSAYVRTLVHDPDSYVARTELFNAIMYVAGGLDRVDRELGALSASLANGCRYCANVHARRHIELSGRTDTVAALWRNRRDMLGAREQAVIAFSEALTATPPTADKNHIRALREVGFDEREIVDLIHAVAIFGWANRLMHPLGRAES